MLIPLPNIAYELATWKVATVQFNYCITVEKMNYSVPNEYIKHKVDVRITKNIIEVFFNGTRICSHPRLHGCQGQYSILEEHMPEKHRQYANWNGEKFLEWAERIGPNTRVCIKGFLTAHRVEEQGYKSCMAALKLADKYSVSRLEAACKRALCYTPKPHYRSISSILQTGQDRVEPEVAASAEPKTSDSFGFVRGSSYYGGEK